MLGRGWGGGVGGVMWQRGFRREFVAGGGGGLGWWVGGGGVMVGGVFGGNMV